MALEIEWLGRVPYGEALDLQKAAVEDRRSGRSGDRLLLLEHPPVVTLGRSARPENLRLSPAALAERGIDLHEVGRGGDVTYHAPGQLVGYAIVDLAARDERDVHVFLRRIEGTLIQALEDLGLPAGRVPGWTGVFVPDTEPPRKIASIGVGLRGWVSFHGFALNVDLDLEGFDVIVPCGLEGVEMTSVRAECARADADCDAVLVREGVASAFAREFA
ncbi:MAG: lipoyl(octanoyl) transferase LipB [Myxococcota bacterium]|nr:lipoyl(octanoyl) transferase LipB [Myxococcota bacterium]